ncbi:hypothetical protein ZWY2020_052132 [Hordeum vulgare]|nr:hypothetical protein ZWY2020_052132 [Hordeum vulgare]
MASLLLRKEECSKKWWQWQWGTSRPLGTLHPAARHDAELGGGGRAHLGQDHTTTHPATQDLDPDLHAAAGHDLEEIIIK